MLRYSHIPYFNSTMVRLKECDKFVTTGNGTYFNSTMVRLKAVKFTASRNQNAIFQFHYGTIKRYNGHVIKKLKEISIPLWYD